MTKFCPNCGTKLKDTQEECPNCKYDFVNKEIKKEETLPQEAPKKSNKKYLTCIVAIAIIILLAVIATIAFPSTSTTDSSSNYIQFYGTYNISGVNFTIPNDVVPTSNSTTIVNFKYHRNSYYICKISSSDVSDYTTSGNGYEISGPISSDIPGQLYAYKDNELGYTGYTLILNIDNKYFIINGQTDSGDTDGILEMFKEIYDLNHWS